MKAAPEHVQWTAIAEAFFQQLKTALMSEHVLRTLI